MKVNLFFFPSSEQGGWADHVVPVVPEKGTPGEWMTDPYNNEDTPVGPGNL